MLWTLIGLYQGKFPSLDHGLMMIQDAGVRGSWVRVFGTLCTSLVTFLNFFLKEMVNKTVDGGVEKAGGSRLWGQHTWETGHQGEARLSGHPPLRWGHELSTQAWRAARTSPGTHWVWGASGTSRWTQCGQLDACVLSLREREREREKNWEHKLRSRRYPEVCEED